MHAVVRCLVLVFGLAALPVSANSSLERLLAATEAPPGVIIEIIDDDAGGLATTLPLVRDASARLRARFPGLPIAVVSHGEEQFGLLSENADGELAPIHAEARSLGDADIALHVCGAHAGWYGHGPEDFPDYVDVSPSGPAQINDYLALGYLRLRF